VDLHAERAEHILNCSWICASVRSVASSWPLWKRIPRASSKARAAVAWAWLTWRMAATRPDWLSRSL
jgi:hypothetical protein